MKTEWHPVNTMEKRSCYAAGISRYYMLWYRLVLSGEIYPEGKGAEDISLSECFWADTLDVSAFVLYYDFISVCLAEWQSFGVIRLSIVLDYGQPQTIEKALAILLKILVHICSRYENYRQIRWYFLFQKLCKIFHS